MQPTRSSRIYRIYAKPPKSTAPSEPGERIPDRPSDCYYYVLVARKP
jgi:hypothetical protein